jgi:hypothetical protein
MVMDVRSHAFFILVIQPIYLRAERFWLILDKMRSGFRSGSGCDDDDYDDDNAEEEEINRSRYQSVFRSGQKITFIRPSVRPLGTARLPLDRFFMKLCIFRKSVD